MNKMNLVQRISFIRHQNTVFLYIFLFGMTLRLATAFYYVNLGEGFWHTADVQYDLIASSIASGKGYYVDGNNFEGLDKTFTGKEKIYSFRSPLYPYLLAGLYKTFGRTPLMVGTFQALMSSLTVLLVFLIARKLFNVQVALGAALVAAVYPYSVVHDIRIFDTSLFEFILGWLVLSIMRLSEKPNTLNCMITGSLLGLGVLCRMAFVTFSIFLFIPFFIAYKWV